MVSRRLLHIVTACSFAVACGILFGCGVAGRPQPTSNVVSGGLPFVTDVEPAAASPGETLTVNGRGFSYIAPENVVAVGTSSGTAEAYEVTEDGTESLVFTLPEDAVIGDSELLVIVEGRASNPVPFTVLPSP